MLKNYKLYKMYRKLVKENQEELLQKFNLRVDEVGRLYTVINLPPQADTYGPKDGPRITASLLKNWLSRLDEFLISKSIKELTAVETMQEIDESNYLLIIRFKFLNMARIATISSFITAFVVGVTVIATIVIALIKLFF